MGMETWDHQYQASVTFVELWQTVNLAAVLGRK